MKSTKFLPLVLALGLFAASCNNDAKTPGTDSDTATTKGDDTASTKAPAKLKEEEVTYSANGVTLKGFAAYDENMQGTRPVVLVVPEWWGLTDYPRQRARQLAELGYLAMAVDMYGDGKTAESPEDASKLATPFYSNTKMAKQRFDAALAKVKTFAQADTSKIAAIGYCFGGAMVINMAKLGDKLSGVVSFHGNLVGVPVKKELLTTPILVCHGAADTFVPQTEVDQFKKQMDSIGATYTFKAYADATHAFTNPGANEKAKKYNMPISYNEAADKASWNDMKAFFATIFK